MSRRAAWMRAHPEFPWLDGTDVETSDCGPELVVRPSAGFLPSLMARLTGR